MILKAPHTKLNIKHLEAWQQPSSSVFDVQLCVGNDFKMLIRNNNFGYPHKVGQKYAVGWHVCHADGYFVRFYSVAKIFNSPFSNLKNISFENKKPN